MNIYKKAELQLRVESKGFKVRGLTDITSMNPGNGVVFYPSDPNDRRSCIAFTSAEAANKWLDEQEG